MTHSPSNASLVNNHISLHSSLETSSDTPSVAALMTLDHVSFKINGNSPRFGQRTAQGWLNGARSMKRQAAQNVVSAKKATGTIENERGKSILNQISMHILPNEKISVIGPNGAGKSTLMKLMLGLLTPTSGRILRHSQLSIGYVPQKFTIPAILPLRVTDLLSQVDKQLDTPQLQLLYDRLSITPLLKQQVIHLSGGETQRVLLARALISKPNLLILDEPMQGLDPESERWLYEFIDDFPPFLQCAMVVVSHDLHWVMQGSRRVICLNKHICCEGQPSDLSILPEFKNLFGHQYEQPYIHQPHDCHHHHSDKI